MSITTKAGSIPGPWTFVWDADGDHAIFSEALTRLHGLIAVTVGDDELGHEIDEANARLISAAPEMLAALEQVIRYGNDSKDSILWSDVISDIKSAIQKVRG